MPLRLGVGDVGVWIIHWHLPYNRRRSRKTAINAAWKCWAKITGEFGACYGLPRLARWLSSLLANTTGEFGQLGWNKYLPSFRTRGVSLPENFWVSALGQCSDDAVSEKWSKILLNMLVTNVTGCVIRYTKTLWMNLMQTPEVSAGSHTTNEQLAKQNVCEWQDTPLKVRASMPSRCCLPFDFMWVDQFSWVSRVTPQITSCIDPPDWFTKELYWLWLLDLTPDLNKKNRRDLDVDGDQGPWPMC